MPVSRFDDKLAYLRAGLPVRHLRAGGRVSLDSMQKNALGLGRSSLVSDYDPRDEPAEELGQRRASMRFSSDWDGRMSGSAYSASAPPTGNRVLPPVNSVSGDDVEYDLPSPADVGQDAYDFPTNLGQDAGSIFKQGSSSRRISFPLFDAEARGGESMTK